MDRRLKRERRAARGDERAESAILSERIASDELVPSWMCESCPPSCRRCIARVWKFSELVRLTAFVGHRTSRLVTKNLEKRCPHDPGTTEAIDFPCSRACLSAWANSMAFLVHDADALVVAALAATEPLFDMHFRMTSYCGGKDGTDRHCRCHRCRPLRARRFVEEWLASKVPSLTIPEDIGETTLPAWTVALLRVAIPEDSSRPENLTWCFDEAAAALNRDDGNGFVRVRESVRDGVSKWAFSIPTSRR